MRRQSAARRCDCVPGASIAHRMPGYACSDPVLTKKKTEFCFYCDAAVRKSGMAPPQTGN